MDEHENWDGGDAICVQIGDVLDRGDRELSCLRLLARLARQALGQGGTLALLYGNHEALNFEGVFSYAWEQGNTEFEEEIGRPLDSAYGSPEWRTQFAGNHPSRWAALEPAGLLAGPLFSWMKVAMIVGRSLLVHGGLTMPHLAYYGGIEEMNCVARDWMVHSNADETHAREKKTSAQTPQNGGQSRSEAILRSMPKCLGGGETGESSPVWVRLYSHPSDMPPRNTIAQGMIDSVLSQLDFDRMIVGHTPQRRINAALRSKAWRIDVGSSKGVNNNTAEVLEVFLESHGKEEVWILTESERIPAHKRQTIGGSFFDAF